MGSEADPSVVMTSVRMLDLEYSESLPETCF